MASRRKLFLTHAGELAHLLLRDVGREGLVARFARSYAERYRRKGLLSDPARLPELETTIGREALLVMAGDVRRLLSREFPPGPKGLPRPDEAAFLDAFHAEFLASLIRGMRWSPADSAAEAEMFRRDLEMYRRWGDRPAPVPGIAEAGEGRSGSDLRASFNPSPFPDRCALLLDPAMMEQAHQAAADFEAEVLRTSAQRFHQLGRSGELPARSARRPAPKSAKPPKKLPQRVSKPKPRSDTKKGTPRVSGAESDRRAPKAPNRKSLKPSTTRKSTRH